MKLINQKMVRDLMSASKLVFDSQVPDYWDADIYKDTTGYFGVVVSYLFETELKVYTFVRIDEEEYKTITAPVRGMQPGQNCGHYFAKCFFDKYKKDAGQAERELDSMLNNISPNGDGMMSISEKANRYSKLSTKSFEIASHEIEKGNIYRFLVFDDISDLFWELALEEFERAHTSSELSNQAPSVLAQ